MSIVGIQTLVAFFMAFVMASFVSFQVVFMSLAALRMGKLLSRTSLKQPTWIQINYREDRGMQMLKGK